MRIHELIKIQGDNFNPQIRSAPMVTLKTMMLGGIPPGIQHVNELEARNLALLLMICEQECAVLASVDIEDLQKISV